MEKTKLLFLPHCLKREYLRKLEKRGKERGYQTYVVPGGSRVKKILNKYSKIDEIVGIACEDETNLALEYTKHLAQNGTTINIINLSKDGCKDTEVNLEEALKALN